MIYEIVRLFLNTLIVDDKQYPHKRDNLTQPINMHLSQKQKHFSLFFFFFFFTFLKSILNFKHFPKNDDRHSSYISKLRGKKNVVR